MSTVTSCVSSLNFHLGRLNVRRMLNRHFHIRGCARLVAALFVVQIVASGLCLLTAEAHAMPQLVSMPNVSMQNVSMQNKGMDGSCAKPLSTVQSSRDQQSSDHSDACFHCDQPDQLSSTANAQPAPALLVLAGFVSLPAAPLLVQVATGQLTARTPTGPPRSSSLLYTTTQRIRV